MQLKLNYSVYPTARNSIWRLLAPQIQLC